MNAGMLKDFIKFFTSLRGVWTRLNSFVRNGPHIPSVAAVTDFCERNIDPEWAAEARKNEGWNSIKKISRLA